MQTRTQGWHEKLVGQRPTDHVQRQETLVLWQHAARKAEAGNKHSTHATALARAEQNDSKLGPAIAGALPCDYQQQLSCTHGGGGEGGGGLGSALPYTCAQQPDAPIGVSP